MTVSMVIYQWHSNHSVWWLVFTTKNHYGYITCHIYACRQGNGTCHLTCSKPCGVWGWFTRGSPGGTLIWKSAQVMCRRWHTSHGVLKGGGGYRGINIVHQDPVTNIITRSDICKRVPTFFPNTKFHVFSRFLVLNSMFFQVFFSQIPGTFI